MRVGEGSVGMFGKGFLYVAGLRGSVVQGSHQMQPLQVGCQVSRCLCGCGPCTVSIPAFASSAQT